MSNNSNVKNTAAEMIKGIHQFDGFDPEQLAVEYTDLNTGESRKRLPVMAQMAWFRLCYPEGKISVSAKAEKDYFVGYARVYRNYMDPADCFLAEATATRKYDPEKPNISPREWAQTAAIGIALRNSGFGLQFHTAGDAFDHLAVDELGALIPSPSAENAVVGDEGEPLQNEAETVDPPETVVDDAVESAEPETEEDMLAKAMRMPCPIKKDGLAGKTLGDLITADPGALTWIATKFTKDPTISAAAKLICETAAATA